MSARNGSWRESLRCQIENLQHTADNLDGSEVDRAVEMVRRCTGLLIFSGVGQNLVLADKVASTFSSLSLRAVSADPVAALHGGMGLFRPEDLLILISKSGESPELLRFLDACRQVGHSNTLAIHSAPGSTLATSCRGGVHVPMVSEADHLDLAPTASSICFLGLLQSLAAELASAAGLSEAAFRRTHPGGTIGLGPVRVR
ncbi:SIS domain-containing protein [Micromonospora rifamycinica]|uniref:SIS domain-containing protein n=1 Tax=Micromonospora rifamycinica TaxID=291594 RepID=UPI0012FB3B53|nr:SIS domain-containing protein [Micromonospora rifamycinica]